MKYAMLSCMLLGLSLLGTRSWADRVNWDHHNAKECGDVKLGSKTFEDSDPVSLVELYGRKGQFTNGASYLFYRLVAIIDGKPAVLWSRPVVYERDWLRGWSCSYNRENKRLGLVALGQRTTCFFDIPLLPTNSHSSLVVEPPRTSDGETSLALETHERLRCIQLLGNQFRYVGLPVDALLETKGDNWILYMKFKQPRRAADGTEMNRPGLEHEVVDAVFTKAIRSAQEDWELSSVTRESWQAAECRRILGEIDVNKKAWYEKRGRSKDSVLDVDAFLKEQYEVKVPHCPEGGEYKMGTFDEPAACSIHGAHRSRLSFKLESGRKSPDR